MSALPGKEKKPKLQVSLISLQKNVEPTDSKLNKVTDSANEKPQSAGLHLQIWAQLYQMENANPNKSVAEFTK